MEGFYKESTLIKARGKTHQLLKQESPEKATGRYSTDGLDSTSNFNLCSGKKRKPLFLL